MKNAKRAGCEPNTTNGPPTALPGTPATLLDLARTASAEFLPQIRLPKREPSYRTTVVTPSPCSGHTPSRKRREFECSRREPTPLITFDLPRFVASVSSCAKSRQLDLPQVKGRVTLIETLASSVLFPSRLKGSRKNLRPPPRIHAGHLGTTNVEARPYGVLAVERASFLLLRNYSRLTIR